MRQSNRIAALLLPALITAGAAHSGSADRLGTAGAHELRIPVGTRGLALGSATVAAAHGVESIFYNPAGLVNTLGTDAYFANTNYLADMKVRYFAIASSRSFGVLGVTAKVLDLGELHVTTVDAPEGTGQIESITFATLGLSFARRLTDAVSFGATMHYISERVLDAKAHGVAFDLGLQYDSYWRGARLGLVMKSVGPNMSFDGPGFEYSLRVPGDDPRAGNRTLRKLSADFDLPSSFQLGVMVPAYAGGEHSVATYGLFQSNSFSRDEFRGGLEYAYQDLLMVRGGYAFADQTEYLFGPTFGLGLMVPMGGSRISVDYAFQTVDAYFEDLHTFSIRAGF